ncbi:hypothetical protein Tco_1315880 [Tanacetum coccineum]
MGRDTIQLENAVSTISQEYLLEFTWSTAYQRAYIRNCLIVFPTIVDWRTSAPKDEMPTADSYHAANVAIDGPVQPNQRPNPSKVKTGILPRTRAEEQAQDGLAHEEPPKETSATTEIAQEVVLEEGVAVVKPLVNKRQKQLCRKRGNEDVEVNAPPKVIRRDHASGPAHSTDGRKSLASMRLEAGIPIPTPTPQETPTYVSDPDQLSYAKPQSVLERDVAPESSNLKDAVVARDPDSEKSTSYSHHPLLPPFWVRQNLPKKLSSGIRESRKLRRKRKLKQEVQSLKAADTEVRGLRNQTKNIKNLLEAKVDIKRATEAKNAELGKELESLHAKLADLQLNNHQLSQHVSTLQAQVTGEERIKAAFKEFKRLEDEKPHMLTAIAGHCWVIGHGLCLAVMKCAESTDLRQAFADVVSAGIVKGMSEGLKYGVEHEGAKLDLAALEAYDPEAEGKYIAALTALRDMKYPLVDQLEQLKDAPIDLLMASLHLESDTEEDAPPFIRDLRPSSSQLKIPVYPEVREPKDPWAVKEEMLLEDVVAANISHAEKKRKCRIVCQTHGVGFVHQARLDGVPVSMPTVIPQGL